MQSTVGTKSLSLSPALALDHSPAKRNAGRPVMRFGALVLLAFTFACAFSAQALLIDDFRTPQSAAAPSFVSGPGILGTERDISLTGGGKSFTAGGGAATFSGGPTAGIGVAILSWDGLDANTALSFGLPETDLTDGGLSDRFILDILSITGILTLTIVAGDSFLDRSLSPPITISNPGIVEVPFADFAPFVGGLGAEFAAVNGIYFGFATNDPGPNESITIGAFRTAPIPEPSSALLVAIGLCLMSSRLASRCLRTTSSGPRCYGAGSSTPT
jgi:hypothetical protein